MTIQIRIMKRCISAPAPLSVQISLPLSFFNDNIGWILAILCPTIFDRLWTNAFYSILLCGSQHHFEHRRQKSAATQVFKNRPQNWFQDSLLKFAWFQMNLLQQNLAQLWLSEKTFGRSLFWIWINNMSLKHDGRKTKPNNERSAFLWTNWTFFVTARKFGENLNFIGDHLLWLQQCGQSNGPDVLSCCTG